MLFRKPKVSFLKGFVFILEFDTGKTIQYWLEGANYDIGVAKTFYKE